MNNAKELRAFYREYRDSVYADYPQVKKFEDRKYKLLKFLLLFSLIIHLAKIYVYYTYTGTNTGFSLILLLVGTLIGMGPTIIFLLAAMTPKWKIAFVLYFPPLQFFLQVVKFLSRTGMQEIGRFIHAYTSGFFQHPLVISLDILSWLLILMILGTAIWLTLIPESRKLADQSEELNEKVKQYVLSHPVR